ncbi:MAG: ABC transporter ATP-binding protein [Cyanobacteria bacterium P01_A01_bin.135]
MSEPLLQVNNLDVTYRQTRTFAPDPEATITAATSTEPSSVPANDLTSASVNTPTDPRALKQIHLTLQKGDRLGLVGESGCGKSTLGRAVMRLLPPATQVSGQVLFNGEPVLEFSPQRLRQFRGEAVALVFQDPMTRLNPVMTVGGHCLETLRAHEPRLPRRQAVQRVADTFKAVRIPPERQNQYPHEFSGGMRQRVAIALALLLNPQLIVADEPTTSLDVTVAAEILQELVRLCRERDMALVLISHDLSLVAEYCDRIAVMLGGEIVEAGSAQAVLRDPQHPYTLSLRDAAARLQAQAEAKAAAAETVAPLLQLVDLVKHYPLPQPISSRLRGQRALVKAVDGINLTLQTGEILGLVGESGCGKSTLSRTVLQLVRPTSGQVLFRGQDLTQLSRSQMQQTRRHLQMVFQDPHACLNPMMTVGRAIAEPLLIHGIEKDMGGAKPAVMEMLNTVGLSPDIFFNRYPKELSGGQQQRVAIARALITRPKLLICDEPVSMLDASIQTQVLELMLTLKQGFDLTYLFITHDLWVARFFCDRIAVMQGGQIVELGEATELFNAPQHPYTQKLLNSAPKLVLR